MQVGSDSGDQSPDPLPPPRSGGTGPGNTDVPLNALPFIRATAARITCAHIDLRRNGVAARRALNPIQRASNPSFAAWEMARI